jgi:hypothetical protein
MVHVNSEIEETKQKLDLNLKIQTWKPWSSPQKSKPLTLSNKNKP